MLQFKRKLLDGRFSLAALLVAAAIKCLVPCDPRKKRIEIVPRLMGRNAVPRLQIHIVFALLRRARIARDRKCKVLQTHSVAFPRLRDSALLSRQIQRHNGFIVQVFHLLLVE